MIRQNATVLHAKQACYLCLNPEDNCDTEVMIDYEGFLSICRSCVASMAQVMGFDLFDRKTELEILVIERDAATARADEAEALLDELQSAATELRVDRQKRAKAAKAAAKQAVSA